MKRYLLNQKEAATILEEVLERCDLSQNSIPLETLESYSNYRKERYAFQKRALIVIMLIFVLLPFFFFTLNMSISKKDSQYLTLFNLKVDNYFPIEKIEAKIGNQDMPIFETSDKNYVIKATKNGEMEVTVQLWNRQIKKQTVVIEGCDETPPILVDYQKTEDKIYIYAYDEQSGLKYGSAYSILEDGTKEYPIAIDQESNCFIFSLKPADIYILDNATNKLHISMK